MSGSKVVTLKISSLEGVFTDGFGCSQDNDVISLENMKECYKYLTLCEAAEKADWSGRFTLKS